MRDVSDEIQPPIEVPAEHLDSEVLRNLIESFVLREGTDYGAVEINLSTKIEQVSKQILRGDVKIVFDPNSETVTLMTAKDFAASGVRASL